MIETSIVDGRIIDLGKQGENLARVVYFTEPTTWVEMFGKGSFELLHRRSGELVPYPVLLDVTDDSVAWKLTATDTAFAGRGRCELRYIANDVVVKSQTYTTIVAKPFEESDAPSGSIPWVDEVLEAKTEVLEARDEVLLEADDVKRAHADLNDIASEVRDNAQTVSEQIKTLTEKADVDLKNVPNDAFKQKAGEAGIGGTSGAMVFRGTVNALPSVANDGDVYKVKESTPMWSTMPTSAIDCAVEWQHDSMFDDHIIFTANGEGTPKIFSTIGEMIPNLLSMGMYEGDPITIKMQKSDGTECVFVITTANLLDMRDFGGDYFIDIAGNSTTNTIPLASGDEITFSVPNGEKVTVSMVVRFNGEWENFEGMM